MPAARQVMAAGGGSGGTNVANESPSPPLPGRQILSDSKCVIDQILQTAERPLNHHCHLGADAPGGCATRAKNFPISQ